MGKGFLAIWSDVDSADETDYLHWLTREHVQERLSIEGFRSARVFRAEAESAARFLIIYRLADPSVVGSADYLARLNAPSVWSQKVMPKLKNFMRGGGAITAEYGGEGGFVAPILFSRAQIKTYVEVAAEIVKADRMAATRVYEVDPQASEIATNEKAMRKGDRSFESMLLLEALDENVLASGLALMEADDRLIYRQIYSLRLA